MTPFNVAIVEYVRRGLDFSGRATRSQYWWPRLLVFVVNLLGLTLFLSGGGLEWLTALIDWSETRPADLSSLDLPALTTLSTFALTFIVVFGLLTFLPDIAVSWRRFHDLDKPGWIHLIFMFAGSLSLIFTLAELGWLAFPGTKGSNRYGPDPLDDRADIFN